MKNIIVLGMFLLFAAAVAATGVSTIGMPLEYHNYIKAAEKNEEKKIYIGAIEDYQKALEYKPDNVEIKHKIALDYLALEEDEEYVAACKSIIDSSSDEKIIMELADYYVAQDEAEEAITLLREQLEEDSDNKKLKDKLKSLSGEYDELYIAAEYISNMHNGNYVFKRNDKYGLLDATGDKLAAPTYESAGVFDKEGNYAPVCKDGEYYYMDSEEYRRMVPDENYDTLGSFSEGLAVVSKDGKYGYLNEEEKEASKLQWDAASVIYEGIGAVKKGDKWALIDAKCKEITDYQYEDVIMDDMGYCSVNQVVWVKENGTYHLVDKDGKKISKDTYEDARPFTDDGAAAAKKNGKWGFVTADGKEILDFTYADAKSFGEGFAPVLEGELWGYINQEGKTIIEPAFADAKPFCEAGTAPVQIDEMWTLIQLDTYK